MKIMKIPSTKFQIKGIKPQGKPWTLFSKETPPQADGVLKTLINPKFQIRMT